MAMDTQPESSPDATPDREAQEIVNLRLTEETLRQQLMDLRRPYLFRNPQLLTALITSIGAIIGVFLLVQGNYFKNVEENNRLQAEKTERVRADAKQASDSAELARQAAAKTMTAAVKTEAEADKKVSASRQKIKAARDLLFATRRQLDDAQIDLDSRALAAKAEELVAKADPSAAQDVAIAAWKRKHTDVARKAVTHAYSLPVIMLEGHNGTIATAMFSPDGGRVLTAAFDDTARVWDATTGKALTLLSENTVQIGTAAFSPDGTRVITAANVLAVKNDITARIWDALSGKTLVVLRGHTAGVIAAAFSPDGQLVATGSLDTTARVWDITGKLLAVLRGHPGTVGTVAFSPDSKRVVTTSGHASLAPDNTARVWNATTGKELAVLSGRPALTIGTAEELEVLRGHNGPVLAASFSPNGQYVVTAGYDGTVRVWDVATEKEPVILRVRQSALGRAVFSPNGKRVLTAGGWLAGADENTAKVWDAASGKELAVLGGHGNAVIDAAFSPDGKYVVATGYGTATIYRVVSADDVEILFR